MTSSSWLIDNVQWTKFTVAYTSIFNSSNRLQEEKVFSVCLSSERMKNNVGMNSISKSLIQILRDWWKISRLNCCPSCFQFKVQNLVPIIRFVILVSIFMLIFLFSLIINLYLIKIESFFLTAYNGWSLKKGEWKG